MGLKRVDTVLFDLDGTLLDTLDDLSASVNYALGQAGLPLVSCDEVRLAAGYASVVLIDRLTGHRYPTDSPEFLSVWQCFGKYYATHHNDLTKPYPGIEEMLGELARRECRMAIVSNKVQTDTEALRQLWFTGTIPLAVGYTPERPRKPAPDMAWAAIKALRSTPPDTIYVGDSEPDVQIARNAGCYSVACSWGFRSREVLENEHPDYIIDHPLELVDIYDRLA